MINTGIRIGDSVTYVPDDPYARPLKLPTGIDLQHFYKVLDKTWVGTIGLVTYYTIKGATGTAITLEAKNVKLYKRG